MENTFQTFKITATHSQKKALEYLGFTIFMFFASIGIIILLVTYSLDNLIIHEHQPLSQTAIILIGLGLLSASLISLNISIRNYLIAHQLEKDGQFADGVITNKWEDTFEGRMMYYVSYRLWEGVEVCESISKKFYSKLNKGSNIPIRYLKHNPSILRMEHDKMSIK